MVELDLELQIGILLFMCVTLKLKTNPIIKLGLALSRVDFVSQLPKGIC